MPIELTPDQLYRLSIRNDGKVDAANRVSDGATVWCPNNSAYTADNPDTAQFMAGNYNLSDRAASPSPAPAPDYVKFRTEIMASPAYLRIASVSLQTLAINTSLNGLFWELASDPAIATEIVTTWNRMVALTVILPAEVTALNKIAADSGVELKLAANGQMAIAP